VNVELSTFSPGWVTPMIVGSYLRLPHARTYYVQAHQYY
jgi:hypothetical protein